MTLKNVTEELLEKLADLASRNALIQSMTGARREPDEQGRFYDHKKILYALKATDAYGRAFRGR
ncbi:MAG: hypothetical protein H6Q55_3599, partial [Deltaproteobacteria bacterium]|nr:hypothetical protein [Deltaproteobacteria bacterium]